MRYRLLHVDGPGQVDDVVSRWTDTEFSGPAGRIIGNASRRKQRSTDPQPAGRRGRRPGAHRIQMAHSLSRALPPGTHNLVGYALDGSYRTFQQGATVAPDLQPRLPWRSTLLRWCR